MFGFKSKKDHAERAREIRAARIAFNRNALRGAHEHSTSEWFDYDDEGSEAIRAAQARHDAAKAAAQEATEKADANTVYATLVAHGWADRLAAARTRDYSREEWLTEQTHKERMVTPEEAYHQGGRQSDWTYAEECEMAAKGVVTQHRGEWVQWGWVSDSVPGIVYHLTLDDYMGDNIVDGKPGWRSLI